MWPGSQVNPGTMPIEHLRRKKTFWSKTHLVYASQAFNFVFYYFFLFWLSDNHCPYMVFEYMEYGDLTELLRCNDPFSAKGPKLEIKQVSKIFLIVVLINTPNISFTHHAKTTSIEFLHQRWNKRCNAISCPQLSLIGKTRCYLN